MTSLNVATGDVLQAITYKIMHSRHPEDESKLVALYTFVEQMKVAYMEVDFETAQFIGLHHDRIAELTRRFYKDKLKVS